MYFRLIFKWDILNKEYKIGIYIYIIYIYIYEHFCLIQWNIYNIVGKVNMPTLTIEVVGSR